LNRVTGIRLETLMEYLSLDGAMKRLSVLTVPDEALTWHRFFGALLLVLLVLLFLSGAFMAFYYSPAPGSAYDSVDYALFSLPFGGIIKGIHHYGWNLFLVVGRI
jgi:quinol-cytochrome oxidoreductase complex cytochrome b subunit